MLSYIFYAALYLIGLAIAGGVIIFIASLSAIIGGVLLVVFTAIFIIYVIKDFFRR